MWKRSKNDRYTAFVFASFLDLFCIVLHRFCIVLASFCIVYGPVFHRFWIVFASFLDFFCIVLFAHTFSQGQYLTYLKKGKCLDKKLKNICFSYSMPSFDPESKYRHKTSEKTKQLNQLSCPLSVYLCCNKKKRKKEATEPTLLFSLCISMLQKKERKRSN